MAVKYLDPYKDDPYGKLRGDKSDAYVKIDFDEAKLHKTDNAFILAAYVTAYSGVVRNYKPSEPLVAGLCAIPIYGSEYEIREKDTDGNWKGVKYQPSIYEEIVYKYIKELDEQSQIVGKHLRGSLAFLPNDMVASLDASALQSMLVANTNLATVDPQGKLKDYTVPSNNAQRRSGGFSRGISPDEKIAFIKKQLVSDIRDTNFKPEHTLHSITKQFLEENADNEQFIEIYFDMLMTAIK